MQRMAWRLMMALVAVGLCACDNSNTTNEQGPGGVGGGGTGGTGGIQLPKEPPVSDGEGPAISRAIFAAEGATEFMTANEKEQLSNGVAPGGGGNARGELDDFAESDSDGAGIADPAPGEPEAVPDPTREIVEADVFKLEGDLLYVLNSYRGLVIIDVSNPDDLRIVGRLPFQSVPVEMYVREGRAYVVSSDYFTFWQFDKEADPLGFHGSEVMVIDVDDAARPTMLGRVAVDGEVTDTRMVGDVLYTVSKRRPNYWRYNTADWEDRTWIVSMNVGDPENITEVDRITFQGMSTLIHVAHHAIFVAAWDPNFYLTDPDHEQETLVTYVDISDEDGDLRERGKVYIPGQIRDKFKMNWHEGKFRVFSQRWREDGNITLHVVNTDRPDELDIDAELELEGVTRSGLLASRFDGDRAFAMSQYWSRPNTIRELHAVDLSGAPRHADVLRINVQASHFEVHGDRLLALGRHYADRTSRTAMALYDIADIDELAVLDVEPLGTRYSNSGANNDYKALRTFPELGLILLPLNLYDGNRYQTGVQILDWEEDDLTERGHVVNQGGVLRAFPVQDKLVAVGGWSISTIDAEDRDNPEVTDRLELVRVVHDVFQIDGLQVQLVTDPYAGNVPRFEVREFGEDDDGPLLAALDLPFSYAPYVLRDGDALHMIGWEQDRGQVIRNADLSEPLEPRLLGELELTSEYSRIHNQGMSFYAQYWSPYAGLPLRNQILPVTFRTVVEQEGGRRNFSSKLRFIDLRELDNPRIAQGSLPMDDYPFVNKITHGDILYSTHVEEAKTVDGESMLYHVRAFVDRVDVSNPDNPVVLPSLNVPGFLVDVSDDGRLLYTLDFQWDDFGRRRNALNVLRVDGDVARVVTVVPVTDQVRRSALRPGWLSEDGGRNPGWHDRTIWVTAHKYPWWGVRGDTVESRQPYTVVRRLDFTEDGGLESEASSILAGYHFDLLDVDEDRAYFASKGPTGLLVLNVRNAAEPVIEYASRTIGYLSRIVAHEGHVYTPMGHFGLRRY